MTDRQKNKMALEVSSKGDWPELRMTDGKGQTSKSKSIKRRDDLEMQDDLLETFRDIIETAMTDLRKEELRKGFSKVEEGR